MRYALVLDTETTSIDKPFCYDCGYVIANMDNGLIEKECHFVIEQNWHNLPLFESAYYKEKRPLYVKLMRSKKAQLVKWGKMTQTLARDIKVYGITDVYAYNSDFDDKVFAFNCDWFKTINPLETLAVHDIWGYASQFVTNRDDYADFCEKHELFTSTGNYRGSAEAVYQFLNDCPDFVEAHMGLYDSQIEYAILLSCITRGADWATDYKVNKILPRERKTPFTVKINGKVLYKGEYVKKYVRENTFNFTVRE